MQNKDNLIRIVKEITKEYRRKILDEDSKLVRGFESYIDKMIALCRQQTNSKPINITSDLTLRNEGPYGYDPYPGSQWEFF